MKNLNMLLLYNNIKTIWINGNLHYGAVRRLHK